MRTPGTRVGSYKVKGDLDRSIADYTKGDRARARKCKRLLGVQPRIPKENIDRATAAFMKSGSLL